MKNRIVKSNVCVNNVFSESLPVTVGVFAIVMEALSIM